MTRAYLSLSLVLVIIFLSSFLFRRYSTKPADLRLLSHIESINDPEGRLARGAGIKFSTADMWALELIPGISDTLAGNILERRRLVQKATRNLAKPDRYKALELVHGVGPKSARKLEKVVALNE